MSVDVAESHPEIQVDDLRKKIDAFDVALVRLLNARAACALEIGRVKGRIGLPVDDPDREGAILGNVQRLDSGPLGDDALCRLFERVLDEARRLEKPAPRE
ncbi:MAG TPA: chorismate mutase [Vicinamibacterales bacterium]|nr:chorismate mutase [Vicinamibacterales bacterium]